MSTAKEIAQWVIDNRYPKGENDKVSDFEMYHELLKKIEELFNAPPIIDCSNCIHINVSKHVNPCYSCNDYSEHKIKGRIIS